MLLLLVERQHFAHGDFFLQGDKVLPVHEEDAVISVLFARDLNEFIRPVRVLVAPLALPLPMPPGVAQFD